MDKQLQQAVDIIAEVCAKSVGNLQYHRMVEQAMSTILMALQTMPPTQEPAVPNHTGRVIEPGVKHEPLPKKAHGVDMESAVEAMAKSVEHWEKEE